MASMRETCPPAAPQGCAVAAVLQDAQIAGKCSRIAGHVNDLPWLHGKDRFQQGFIAAFPGRIHNQDICGDPLLIPGGNHFFRLADSKLHIGDSVQFRIPLRIFNRLGNISIRTPFLPFAPKIMKSFRSRSTHQSPSPVAQLRIFEGFLIKHLRLFRIDLVKRLR